MVACQTWRFAASMKNSRNGTNVAASTNSYSEFSRPTSMSRTVCDSPTATTWPGVFCSGPISETFAFHRFHLALRSAAAACCSGARYFGQSALNWSARVDQRISDRREDGDRQQHDQQRAERARNAHSLHPGDHGVEEVGQQHGDQQRDQNRRRPVAKRDHDSRGDDARADRTAAKRPWFPQQACAVR